MSPTQEKAVKVTAGMDRAHGQGKGMTSQERKTQRGKLKKIKRDPYEREIEKAP